jgi:predicted nucleic acid-binding protein
VILVDTSIWVDHLARGDAGLTRLLDTEAVLEHPFVTAEIALGSLASPGEVIGLLDALPQAPVASHGELMLLIERQRLGGSGIGFVDAHLLAAGRLSGSSIWTRDKRLRAQAQRLGCSWAPG